MRIFTFCYCLYSILIPSILTESKIYGIVNLDSKTTGSDVNLLSQNLQNEYNNKRADFTVSQHTTTKKEEIKIRANSSKTVLEMDESQHLIINSNKFYHAKNQSEIFNYKINAYIDKGIVPENYYNGYTSITNTPNVLSCNYNNTIPIFGFSNITLKLQSVVNTPLWNFGLDDSKHIKCFKIGDNFEIIAPEIEGFSDQSNYEQLFYPTSILSITGYSKLFAIRNNNNNGKYIDMFDINNSDSKCSLSFHKTSEINSNKINQIATSGSNIYVATGDIGLVKISDSQNINFENSPQNITDIILNSKTLYAINGGHLSEASDKKGLYIFNSSDFIHETPTQYLSHPYLVKFDVLLDDYNNHSSTHYIGIVVDNHPNEKYPEILIELIINSDLESFPKINKIFLTNQDIYINDIVTDIYSYYSYILDKTNKQLYTLTRGIPNFQDSFSYVRSLEEILTNEFAEDHLSIITLPNQVNALLIHEQNQSFVAMDLIKFSQTLECVFHKGGEYIEKVTEGYDCSTNMDGKYELKICLNDVEFYINVTEEEPRNRAGLWVALVIGIIVIVFIIGGVLYFTFSRKRKSEHKDIEIQQNESQKQRDTQEVDYQKGNVDDKAGIEIEEANFDNKY